MLSIFGDANAQWLASRFPSSFSAVVCDVGQEYLAAGYREAMRRRELGAPFYGMLLVREHQSRVANDTARLILAQIPDYDTQYSAFQQLHSGTLKIAGKTSAEAFMESPPVPRLCGEFLLLCDEIAVRSYAEYTAILASGFPSRTFSRILLEASIPRFESVAPARPSVVVWCGLRPASDAQVALFGLREFRGDVTYVSDEPAAFDFGFRHLHPSDPELPSVLGRSAAVVCIDPEDPADAVAFSRTGIGVVATQTSNAREFVHGVVNWNPTNAAGVYEAVAMAMSQDTAPVSESFSVSPVPAPRMRPPAGALPLVSIITATRNRPAHLRRMLTCLAAQTYANIESIVVNDAGCSVDEIVAEFPFARVINLQSNRGTLGAAEAGLGEARGDFIGLLPDDDWLYPNHVELLVGALRKSGAAVSHGMSQVRYLRPTEDGGTETYGFNGLNYNATVSPTRALISTPVAGHQCLQARRSFDADDVGWYLKNSIAADQEYHFRLVERHQLAFVPLFTCEFRDHPGNSGKLHNWAEAVKEVYDLNPLPHRPLIEAQRRQTVAMLQNVPAGQNVHSPSFSFEPEPQRTTP